MQAADHRHAQKRERYGERERFRAQVTEQMAIECACDARAECAHCERDDDVSRASNPATFGGHRAHSQCRERAPGKRAGEVARDPGNEQKNPEQQIIIAEIACELDAEQPRPRHEQALPAACEGFPLEQHLLHDESKAERRNGEVVPLYTQGWQGDEGPEESSHDSSEDHAKQEWQSELDDAQSEGRRADRPERRVPYGYLPPNAEQNIEAERDQGIDHDGREEIVAVVAQPERIAARKRRTTAPQSVRRFRLILLLQAGA